MLRWIALIACALLILRSVWIALSLDRARLTEWGWGYLTAQIILFVSALIGFILIVRSLVRRADT